MCMRFNEQRYPFGSCCIWYVVLLGMTHCKSLIRFIFPEFTTLTAIAGEINYNGAKIQIVDLRTFSRF